MRSQPIPLRFQSDPLLYAWAIELQSDQAPIGVTADYQAEATDATILADATGGALTVTLPRAAASPGQELCIKRLNGGGNNVTIEGSGAETIDGAANVTLGAQYAYWRGRSNGTAWYTFT